MIREIRLKRFGKFTDQVFPLSIMTLFLGTNESGKTTLFDGLFKAMCNPKTNKRHGKHLKDRYGGRQDVKLVFSGEPFEIDEDEFLQLYAIRSGDIHLSFAFWPVDMRVP